MIGLGSWKCSIHHSFFDGEATLTVREENGEYRFDTTVDGHDKVPEYVTENIVVTGNRIEGDLKIKMVPMKMKFWAEFDNDVMNGEIIIPFVGNIKVENAVKIS